jgi:hypothetical protein
MSDGDGDGVGVGFGLGGRRRRRRAKAFEVGSTELNPAVISAALPPAVVRRNSRRETALFLAGSGFFIGGCGIFGSSEASSPWAGLQAHAILSRGQSKASEFHNFSNY